MLKLIGVMTAGHALNEEVEVGAIDFGRTIEKCNFSRNSKLLDDLDAVEQSSLEHAHNKFQISLVRGFQNLANIEIIILLEDGLKILPEFCDEVSSSLGLAIVTTNPCQHPVGG
jgi:hypothetical protein